MTYPAAAGPETPGRSPFAGQFVHVLGGLRMDPGARQPVFDDGIWDLTGVSDVAVQVAPNILAWDFTKIEHAGWRLVARELLIAVLAPAHEQVLAVPLARRDPLALATCHSRLSAVTTWFQWLSGQGIRCLEQVTQEHCDRYLQQRQHDDLGRGGRYPVDAACHAGRAAGLVLDDDMQHAGRRPACGALSCGAASRTADSRGGGPSFDGPPLAT